MVESNAKFWEEIYNRNIGKMIGICYRYTSNRQLAEVLAHDAFLKAIDRAGSFKGEGVFDAWLRRVVVNHVLTYIRDQRRHQRIDNWLHDEGDVVHSDVDGVFTDQSATTEFSAKELLDVINGLPEHHRVVFNLYVIDDFKHAQIAEALGISEGTSKSHLARARKKIRQLLKEKEQGKRKAIILFLLPQIDRLYNKRFNDFEVVHHKAVPDFSNAPSVSTVLPQTSWISVAASVIGSVIVASVVIYMSQHDNNNGSYLKAELTGPFIDNDSIVIRDAKEPEVIDSVKNNDRRPDSSTATFRPNSVIQRKTINTNRMKTLDSLGIALMMSSALVFDSSAQSIAKVTTSTTVDAKPAASVNESAETTSIVQFSAPAKIKSEKQEGTFYASSLHWSAENHELYFKGKVKVDVGDNHFISTGSVTFLDKVYMLIIDGSPVKPDATIELSKQQYRLKQLTNREATTKYGDDGQNGAVEINEIED